jgi:hypothetical protein
MLSGIGREKRHRWIRNNINSICFMVKLFLYISGKSEMFIFKHSKLNIDFIFHSFFSSCTLNKTRDFSLSRPIVTAISSAESHKTIIDEIHLRYFLFFSPRSR